jgi:hypothetical protein
MRVVNWSQALTIGVGVVIGVALAGIVARVLS